MNKQLKIVAISGIFAIIAGLSVAMNLEKVDAAPGAGVPVKQFGAKTAGIVCGDRLCSEPQSLIDIEEEHNIIDLKGDTDTAPTAKLISIHKYKAGPNQQGEISYKITFSVTAGTANLKDILIHAQSDLGDFDYKISSISSLKSSVQVIRIMAVDPDSITGEIIGYTITGPTAQTGQFPR